MDFWLDNDFDFDYIFKVTINLKEIDPEVATLR